MIQGETVYVIKNVTEGHDRFGNPQTTEQRTRVDNVIIGIGTASEFDTTARFETASNSLTLHFPKTFNKSLYKCSVEVRGEVYEVVGDPMWYTPEDTPTDWNYPVQVVRNEG